MPFKTTNNLANNFTKKTLKKHGIWLLLWYNKYVK